MTGQLKSENNVAMRGKYENPPQETALNSVLLTKIRFKATDLTNSHGHAWWAAQFPFPESSL